MGSWNFLVSFYAALFVNLASRLLALCLMLKPGGDDKDNVLDGLRNLESCCGAGAVSHNTFRGVESLIEPDIKSLLPSIPFDLISVGRNSIISAREGVVYPPPFGSIVCNIGCSPIT